MGTLDSAVGSGSLAESISLNVEVQSSDASNATVCALFPKICLFSTLPAFSIKIKDSFYADIYIWYFHSDV